jgi:hypothetical protein
MKDSGELVRSDSKVAASSSSSLEEDNPNQ